MTTLTAAQELQKIHDAKPETEVRVCRRCDIGQVPAHQGDVYIHRVADDTPRGALWGSKQVAIGDTQGSRHVAEGPDVEVFHSKTLPPGMKTHPRVPEDAYRGPVIVAPSGFTLTHPEHAHHRLPAGVYQVTYQVDAVAAIRVRD